MAQPANRASFGQLGFLLLPCVLGMAVGKEDYRRVIAIAV
jgi:hypothetical protein